MWKRLVRNEGVQNGFVLNLVQDDFGFGRAYKCLMGQLTYRQAWPLKKTEKKTSSLIGNVFLTMGESKPEKLHRICVDGNIGKRFQFTGTGVDRALIASAIVYTNSQMRRIQRKHSRIAVQNR